MSVCSSHLSIVSLKSSLRYAYPKSEFMPCFQGYLSEVWVYALFSRVLIRSLHFVTLIRSLHSVTLICRCQTNAEEYWFLYSGFCKKLSNCIEISAYFLSSIQQMVSELSETSSIYLQVFTHYQSLTIYKLTANCRLPIINFFFFLISYGYLPILKRIENWRKPYGN